jgi:hypothetical protein
MPDLDWERIRQGKDAYRDRMAALPFEEKMRLLERLRVRTVAVARPLPSNSALHGTASNLRVFVLQRGEQVSAKADGNANVAFFGASSTLAVAMAPSQSNALTTSVVKPTGV